MKITTRYFCAFVLLFSVILFPTLSKAENIPIYGCFQKNHGQLRVVNSWSECLDSEVPISWVAQSNDIVDYLLVYVNSSTGLDELGYGLSEDKPFKTIGYALSKIPLLRSHSEIRTTINVAAGTYNESIVVSINKIWLKGDSLENTFIIGDGSTDVVSYSGPIVGRITGISISNGGSGIYCRSSVLTVQDCEISDNNGYTGLGLYNNSTVYLVSSKIDSNKNMGISLSRNSSLLANNSIVSSNSSHGIEVWYTSTARITECEISGNFQNGIEVGSGSSLRLFKSQILNNHYCGIGTTSSSVTAARGGNIIQGNNIGGVDWRGGVCVYQGSEFSVTNDEGADKDQIIENHRNGIFLSNNSTSLIKDAIISNNYGDGIDLNFGCSGQFEELVEITNNNGWGILCSEAVLRNTANVLGNTTGDINCP